MVGGRREDAQYHRHKNVGMHISIYCVPIIIIIIIKLSSEKLPRKKVQRRKKEPLLSFSVFTFRCDSDYAWRCLSVCAPQKSTVNAHDKIGVEFSFFCSDPNLFRRISNFLAFDSFALFCHSSSRPFPPQQTLLQHRHDILSVHRLNQLTPFNWVPSKWDLVVNESIDTHSNFCSDILYHRHNHLHRPNRCVLSRTIHSLTKTTRIIKNLQ